MSEGNGRARPPKSLLDRLTERLLMLVVPGDLREPFAGDLLEEAERFITPERGRWRARLWLWGQIIRSLPALLGRRDGRERELDVKPWKLIMAAVAVLLVLQQAWESRVFESSPLVMGIVFVAIALPIAESFLTARLGTLCLSIVLSVLLLVMAWAISSTPLLDLIAISGPSLLLAGIPWTRQDKAGRSGRSGGAAA